MKVAALNLIAAAVEGLGDSDRNVLAVHAEALKTADRYAKDKTTDSTIRRAICTVCWPSESGVFCVARLTAISCNQW